MSKKQKNVGGRSEDRVKVWIPGDLARAIQASGGDLEDTVEELLRGALGSGTPDSGQSKLSGFLQSIAGPYLPQLEAVAKDVASKVAKDVATAAAAAALTTFATKAAEKPAPAPAAPKPAAPKPAAAKPAARKPAPAPKSRAAARPRPPVKPAPKPTAE